VRVLLAHNHYQVSGGAEFFYLEVGRVLEKMGHQVAYFSISQEGQTTPWKQYFPKGNEFRKKSLLKSVVGFPRMIYSRDAKDAIEKLITDFKPDVLHAFAIYLELTPSILDAAKAANVRILMSCNDYKHICPNYKLFHHGKVCEDCKGGRFFKATLNRCAHDSTIFSVASTLEAYAHEAMGIYRKNVDIFLFASEFMARKTEEFWGHETFKWRKLRNPFNPLQYEANPCPGGYALYFGRIIDEKGVNILIDAALKVEQIPVIIVGDGPDLESLEDQVKATGVTNIKFVGAKWGDELSEIIKGCRYVVVPSLWHENFPYVILQAFAHAKPVIGTKRGGIPEMVRHRERGLLYEATDSEELANAMRTLNSDGRLVERMGIAARSFVESEFNDDLFYENMMRVYNEVLQ